VGRGASQGTVAAKVGCDEYDLRNIEQGKENPTFDVMYAIVAYFDMLPLSRFWEYAKRNGKRIDGCQAYLLP